MQYLIVLLLAVSASATYDYGHSYYPSTYGHGYGGYYGYGSGLGYGVGGYSYAPTSYYSGGAAISKYIAPAVTSYAAPAVTSYAAPAAAISYAAPAVSTIAAAPAVSYVKPAISYAAAPAVSYVKPAVTYAAAPAVSYVKPAVTYAAAPAVSYVKPAVATVAAAPAVSYVSRPAATYVAAAPRIQNPLVKGGSYISFTMGSAKKDHSDVRGSAFNLHRNKARPFPGSNEGKKAEFPEFPKPVTDTASGSSGFNSEVSHHSNEKPRVEYANDKQIDSPHSNERLSDSSFFDATKSSENDNSGYDLLKPDSKDKSSFDSDSFFDGTKSSETDFSGAEIAKPESKNKKSFNSDRSEESNGAGFEDVKSSHSDDRSSHSDDKFSHSDDKFSHSDDRSSHSHDKSSHSHDKSFHSDDKSFHSDDKSFHSDDKSFHSHDRSSNSDDTFSKFDVDVENRKQEYSGRHGIKQSFFGAHKTPASSDGQFWAGTPKIKFVMGNGGLSTSRPFKSIPYPKHVFRDGPTSFQSSLRDRIFYLSEGPAYDYSSVYGPSASLLYDGGDAAFLLDSAEPEVLAFKKK